ncbi:MAG: hypothetical protein ETSY1_02965 [Candidatus Entotheonella factor]|uniref:SGNH hydrolase-type esterase domain-containing protein n=1 Tax=Entotheonella factor TaxID=1429438 RepID=W4LWW4_ENTF1|nr:MAG: hypothetical protein ETSY1_02965 [Candidatus Entotheonella factor]
MANRPVSQTLRALIANISLIATSVALTLGGVELYLRMTRNLPDFYYNFTYQPRLREKLYRYLFPTSYRGDKEALRKFVEGLEDRKQFDAQLGWDLDPKQGRMRQPTIAVQRPPLESGQRHTRVLFLGDSFTFGADVKPLESYPAYTGRLLGVEAPNMAVSGYGIDQAILKYHYHGAKLEPDLVVLGVYSSDYMRAALAFSAYAKPKVTYNPIREMLEVHDEHIRLPQEQLRILKREARWTSYVVAFFETALARLFETDDDRQAHLMKMDRVVFELLAKLKADLEQRGVKLLIVQIPNATAYATVPNWERALVAPIRQHLLKIYEELDIPYIDVMREFLRFASFQELYQHYYVKLPNGKRGHLSPRGNQHVAMLIAELLCKPDFNSDAWPMPLACDDLL